METSWKNLCTSLRGRWEKCIQKDLTEPCCDDGRFGGRNIRDLPKYGLFNIPNCVLFSTVSFIAELISVFISERRQLGCFLFALPIEVSSRLHITVPTVCDRPHQSALSLHFPRITFYVSVIVGWFSVCYFNLV